MNVQDVLDAARTSGGIASDAALADALGVKKQSVSRYRHGVAYPEAVVCEKLAEISGLPLHRVLGIVGEARAISAAEKKVWRRLAAAMFVSMLVAFPASARVNFPTNGSDHEPFTVCIMRTLRKLHAVFASLSRRFGACDDPAPLLA